MIGEVVVTMILRCCLFRKDTPFQLFTFVKKNFHIWPFYMLMAVSQ